MLAAALNLVRIQSSSTWMSSSLSRGRRNLQNLTRLFRAACWTPEHYLPPLHNPSCRCLLFWKSVPIPHHQRECLCAVRLCVFVAVNKDKRSDLSFILDGSTEGREVEHRGWISDQRRSESIVCVNYPDRWFQSRSVCVCVLSPVCVYFPVTIGRAQSRARPQAPTPDLRLTPPGPHPLAPTPGRNKKTQAFSHHWVDVWEGFIIDYWFCLCFTQMLLFLSSEASRNITATIGPFEV